MKKLLLRLTLALSAVLFTTQSYAQCTVLTGPYSEDFESYSTGSSSNPGEPPCWKYYESNAITSFAYPYGYLRSSTFYSNSGSQFLYLYKSSSSTWTGDSAAFMSPKFDLSAGNYEVKFFGRGLTSSWSTYVNKVYVGVSDSAGSTSSITVVDTLELSSATYSEFTVDLSTTAGVGTGDSRVVFMMIADGSTGYAYIDDVRIRVKNSCNDVTNLSAVTSANGVSLSWDGDVAHTSYTIEYDTAGFTPGNGTTLTVTSDSTEITGLTPVTNYDFYVTGNCSATSSSYAVKASAFSPCAALATPYLENFDATAAGSSSNPSLPQCWEYYTGVSNGSSFATYQYTYSSTWSPGYSGSNSLYMNSGSSASYIGDTSISMTPEIQGLDSATKMIEFYGRAGSSFYDGEFYLTFANANGDVSSIRIIDTIKLNSTSWEKYTVYLDGAQTGEARVGFMMICDGAYDYLYLDDINFLDIPPCPEPIAFSLTSATRTSATLAWSSSSAAFDIEVGPMGFAQGTGTTYTSSTSSVTATGLTQNTYYDAYVRANCTSTGDGTSAYVGPFTFKTECGWFASPLTETFGYSDGSGNSSNPDMPDCWDLFKQSTSSSTYANVDFSSWSGNQATDSSYLYLRNYLSSWAGGNVGDTIAAILPMMTDLSNGDQQVLINAKGISTSAAYGNEVAIGTVDSTGDMSTLYIADTLALTSTYDDYTVDLDGVPSNAARVVLVAFGYQATGYTYGGNGGYIDEVTVRQAPQCPEVYDVVATATSDTSAVITWGDSSVVDEYLVDYGLAGFTQGTGVYDTIVGTSWSSNMLMDGETYEFYIQSVCSAMGVNSPWYGPITLDMPCSPTSIPFADGFENKPTTYGNSTNPNLPDCWTYSVNANPGNSYSYGSTSTWGSAYAGTGYVYNRQSNVAGDTVVVSLPMIENLASDGAVLKFWARLSSTFYQGQMAVATTGTMGDYKTAAVAQNMNVSSNTYQQYSVYLDSNVVPSGAQRPAFLFYSIDGSYNYIYLDSVEVEALPSCVAYNFMENNVTDTSADLSWSYTGNNSFNLEYGPTGFIQGTGTGAQAGTTVSSITAPYSLSGLSPNTTYDYYVENACNPGTWYGPFTFTTECTGPLAAGTYTVGATGDFATLDSVMSVLNVCGIGGAVTFEFQAGAHSSSQAIGEINGSSATNTITFKGGAGADTITVGSDAAFVLDGAKHMSFEDLYIYAPGSKGFRLNGTEDITIDGNTIEVGVTTSSLSNPILASASSTSAFSTTVEKDLTITNNELIGGYYGVRIYGSFSARNEDITITGNTISDAYYYGVYVYYGTNVEISENMMSGFGSNFAYGIYPYQVDGLQANKNHVTDAYRGIWAYYTSSTAAASMTSEISNNMLDVSSYGLAIYYADSLGVYHNTATADYPIRDYYNEDNVDIRNNIFQGSTYAYYGYRSDASVDYNLYHATGSDFAYVYDGSTFSYPDSLGALQALDTLNNMNSVEGDPIFAGPNDLHVFGPLANDAGDNSVGITTDIDGDTRPMSGSTVVDMGADEYDVINDDAALTMLVSPNSGVCGDDSLMVSVEIGNFGFNTLTTLTVSADVLGQTLTATPTGLSIPFGGKDTIMLGYVSNYVGGPMSIVAYTTLTNDGRPDNDTLSTSVMVSDAQQVSVSYPDLVCVGDDAVMVPTHPQSGMLLWMAGNDTLSMTPADSAVTLSGLTMDTTITVSSVKTEETMNMAVPTGGYSGVEGQIFTTTQAVTIDSVTIYPFATTGSEVITVYDYATGTTLHSSTVSWSTAANYDSVRVPIGASVGVGTYVLYRGNAAGTWREQYVGSGVYPYYSSDSTVAITGQVNYNTYMSYFFDWKITVGGCDREDTTFTIGIHPDPVAMISVDTANATISATDWTASWSTSGTMNADSVSVEFSNGTTSMDTSGTVTFTANNAGETVTVIAYGPCSSDTATFTFDVNQISVDEDFMNGTLSIYPNPTRGLFNVEFATEQAKDVEISIVNMVGQVISTDVVEVNGVYNNQFDLSNESAGVYFITFTTDEGTLTERITVE